MPATRASISKAQLGTSSDLPSPLFAAHPSDDSHELATTVAPEQLSPPIDSLALASASTDESTPSRRKKRALGWERENRPPRPANAFISFKASLKDGPYQREYAARLASGENIGVIAQHMWRALDEDERDKWYAAAKEAKDEHARKYPNYKYQPQKRHDKKKSRSKTKSSPTADLDLDELEDSSSEIVSAIEGREEADTSARRPSSPVRVESHREDKIPKFSTEPRTVEVYLGGREDLDLLYKNGWKWALIRDYDQSSLTTPADIDVKNPIVSLHSAAEESTEHSMAIELISMASVLNSVDAGPDTPSSLDLHTSGDANLLQDMFNPWDFPAPQLNAFCYDGQPELEAHESMGATKPKPAAV